MLSLDEKQWCVVQTQVNCEFKAVAHLENQGYEVFAPKYKKWITHARKKTEVTRPLFPRYIFILIDFSKDRWRSIRSTYGVSSIIMNGELPSRISKTIIEGLKHRASAEGHISLAPKHNFKEGDQVKILTGAFEQSLGLIESVKDEHRVILLLTFLNREVRTTMASDRLLKVEG